MNPEQITNTVTDILQKMASITTKLDNVVTQVSRLTDRFDRDIDTRKADDKAKGERLGSLEMTTASLKEAVERLNCRLDSTKSEISELRSEVNEIKNKGAKRWEDISFKVTMLIVSGIVLYFMARIGMATYGG